jgi:hypothetical protein
MASEVLKELVSAGEGFAGGETDCQKTMIAASRKKAQS